MTVRTKLAALAALALATGAGAQTEAELGQRVDRIERQLRAVQRNVFPGGQPVAPETGVATAVPAGTPASTPVTDLMQRIDAIEKSLATLTGQVEQQGNRLRVLEEAARAAPAAGTAPPAATAPAVSEITAATGNTVTSAATPSAGAQQAAAATTEARRLAVAAVEVPATGDAIEDRYSYGYRLYAAKLYPEAQAVLKDFVAKHPNHRRANFAQNLLGRAYLDEGKPGLATTAFFANYEKYPQGERTPESLTWLGQALIQVGQPAKACDVYGELQANYATKLTSELRARVAKGRTDAKCPAA